MMMRIEMQIYGTYLPHCNFLVNDQIDQNQEVALAEVLSNQEGDGGTSIEI